MLHDYLHEHTSPGTRSAGYTSGREGQRTGHRSAYDRNGLMYAMLLIKLSMGGGEPHGLASTPYDTIAMHDRICGGGSDNQLYKTGAGPAGWRAATFDAASPTYDVAVTANAFAPVVAMGPLEVLQSMRAATIAECPEGFNTADLSHYLACELNDEAVRQDLVTRAERVPFAMQRDLWCDASAQLSIESSVGNPFYFTENLYDTSVKQRFENGRGYRDMVVPAVKRGEEQMDADFRRKTLMGWVYVTSSSSDLRAGMHRLLDLPVFRSTPCRDLPGVTCTAGRGIYTTYTDAEVVSNVVDSTVDFFEDAASTIWNAFSGTGRRLGTYHHVQLNEELPLIDAASTAPAHATFLTGREALPLHRCSYMVERVTGISCHHAVYAASSARGCTAGSLGLVSQPTAYGAEHWVRARLMTVASPSPPPPPPSPHLPPPPPSPHPPPNPPMRVGQLQVMSQVRDIEERMCTSVYYMSQAARCERLALDLTARVHYDKLSPPGSPPAGPYMPPPPPPPPLPSLPEGLLGTLPRTALLSTNRVPAQGLDAGDGFHTSNLATLLASHRGRRGQRARVRRGRAALLRHGLAARAVPERGAQLRRARRQRARPVGRVHVAAHARPVPVGDPAHAAAQRAAVAPDRGPQGAAALRPARRARAVRRGRRGGARRDDGRAAHDRVPAGRLGAERAVGAGRRAPRAAHAQGRLPPAVARGDRGGRAQLRGRRDRPAPTAAARTAGGTARGLEVLKGVVLQDASF